jgi:hypothetical protein
MDLHSIKTKLIQRVNTLDPSETDLPVDWVSGTPPASPQGPAIPERPSADFRTAIETLQERFLPLGASPVSAPPPVGTRAVLESYGDLRGVVEQINRLSLQQEQAIADLRTLQRRLAHSQPSAVPVIDLNQALVAAAAIDPQGNIALAYRSINLPYRTPPYPGASSRLAVQPRRSPSSPLSWRALGAEALALVQEPSQLLNSFSHRFKDLGQGLRRRTPRVTSPTHAPLPSPLTSLSLVDSIFWFGGGVIGRLVLSLIVAAWPALWSVAVAAITAMMAYALYRATLSPKLAFGPLLRVALMAAGLVLGGQL